MSGVFESIILGVFIIILGLFNMKGNISTIHWYHRRRLAEEDKLPFGRLVGKGTVICGSVLVAFSCMNFVAEKTQNVMWTLVGSGVLMVGMVIGIALGVYAMFKYNKGIF